MPAEKRWFAGITLFLSDVWPRYVPDGAGWLASQKHCDRLELDRLKRSARQRRPKAE